MARKQMEVPGTERQKIKEIRDSAFWYQQKRDERMELSRLEKEAKNALIAAMKKHKVENYRIDDATPPLQVQYISGKENVKVHEVDGAGSFDDEGDDQPEAK